MARKKKRRSKGPDRKPQPPTTPVEPVVATPAAEGPRPANGANGKGVLIGATGVLVLVAAGWGAWRLFGVEPRERIEFPPPRAVEREESAVTYDDFVGSSVCEECHEEQYDKWSHSTHGRAGGAPSREVVIAHFDGTPIRFKDAVVTPSINERGEYLFTTKQEGKEDVVFRVDGVIGGGHMVGGGTQGFVSAFPDGTVRFLPFDFIRKEGVWFCNTDTRAGEGWYTITEDMKLSDCGDWPPIRILGSDLRYGNCQECHGSQINVRFDDEAGQFETRVKSFSINCESCHGPGKRHVELADEEKLDDTEDLAIQVLTTITTDESLEVCFRCHSLKVSLKPGYFPGHVLEDHYSLKTPLLGDRPFRGDGRIRTFAYQQNHLYSDCYLSGSMTCVDCHEPHSMEYWDIYGQALESRFSDDQCLDCHPSKAENIPQHTYHEPDSEGSVCVACHMPYLQHPLLGNELRFARSDHTIPIPRPAFDERLGIENACAPCHEDMTVDSLERATTAWWGELKPHKDIIRGIVEAERGERPATEIPLLPKTPHPIAQIAALNQLFEEYLFPNMRRVKREVLESLLQMAESPDLDVMSVSLAALHLARGEDPEIRAFLAEKLRTLGDRDEQVRQRWAVTFGYFGDAYRARGEFGRAITVYRKALEILPRHAGILHNLGLAYRSSGDYVRAVEFLERSLEIEPGQPLAYVNLGTLFEAQGRPDDAATAYRRALEINPGEALAYFNLGNVHLKADRFRQAIEAYRLAVFYDPTLALGHYYLARSYFMVDELENAMQSVREALALDPGLRGAQLMLRDLERVLGGGGM